jgi:hypothetical protein
VHRRLFLLAFASTLALPTVARAQEARPSLEHYRGIIAANPLGIPLDMVSVELEGAVAPGVTAGFAANYVAPGDPSFVSADAKLRYYPGEVALKGFSVGLGLGVVKYSDIMYVNTPNGQRESLTAPALSVLTDYNWMIGAKQRFVVGAGLGAKRLLASSADRDRVDAPKAYPFARFVIGLAF